MAQYTEEQLAQWRAKETRNKAFTEWRQKTADEMPALATRVFALRQAGYMGCGFHWAMERDLGTAISRLNDYDGDYYHGEDAIGRQIGVEVLVELLYKTVERAEESAALIKEVGIERAGEIWQARLAEERSQLSTKETG